MTDQLVLVVEDDPHFGQQLTDLFEFLGYRVELAISGPDGVERFEAGGVDFLLTDLMLPGMSGVEVVKCVRGLPGGDRLPVMMMSAIYKNPRLFEKELRDLDIVEFVAKPFSLIELGRKIDAVLDDSVELEVEGARITETGSWRIEDIDDALGETGRTIEPLGAFDRRSLFDLVLDLFKGHGAGRLALTRQRSRRDVYFLNGYPVWAESDDPNESVEAVLVRQGVVPLRLMPELQVAALRDGTSVPEAATRAGHCTAEDLIKAEHERVRRVLVGAFKWANGEFEWVPGDDFVDRVAVHEVNPLPCLAEAVRQYMGVDELAPDLESRSEQLFVSGTRRRRLGSYLLLPDGLSGLESDMDSGCTVGRLFQTHASRTDVLIPTLWLMFRIGIADSVEAPLPFPEQLRPAQESGEQSRPPAPAFLPEASDLVGTETVRELQADAEPLLQDYLNLMPGDHYRFLGLEKDANLVVLVKAYRSRKERYQPDGFAGDVRRKVKELSARLELAFDTLSDDDRRAEYDAELARRAAERERRRPGAAERLRSARALLTGGDYDAAFALLEELAGSHPNSAEVLCLLGRCENQRVGGAIDRARELLGRALGIDPFHARALRYLAELERDGGQGEAYIDAVRRLRDLDPDDPWLVLHGA
jgi:CheY-like chemotaxis protein